MKYLVHLSGGLDSAAALVYTLDQVKDNDEVVGVFYNYGQPYLDQERKAASGLASQLNITLLEFHIEMVIESNNQVEEYVPYRNLVLTAHSLSIAAGWFDYVIVGSKSQEHRPDDPYSFKDSTWEFYQALNKLANDITEPDAPEASMIRMPLCGWTKTQVVKYLMEKNIDTELLWTCYGPGPEPCGVCYHCGEYIQAVKEINS